MKNSNDGFSVPLWMCSRGVTAAFIAILLAAPVIQGEAQTYNLSTGSTSIQVGVGGPGVGLSDWMVDGVDQLQQQWFYYSVGGSAVNSINTIQPGSTAYNILGGSAPTLDEGYTNGVLSVTSSYTLQGVDSTMAQLGTQIAIQNLSSSNQVFKFYQFSHFTTGQDVYFENSPYYTVYQYNSSNPAYLEGSITLGLGTTVGEAAGLYDGNQFGLENGNSAPSFSTATFPTAGPGDVDFGYEFIATLAPGGSITIGETEEVVPEPSSLALLASGIIASAWFQKRRLAVRKNQNKALL
jgi:PEP-CTERM motif